VRDEGELARGRVLVQPIVGVVMDVAVRVGQPNLRGHETLKGLPVQHFPQTLAAPGQVALPARRH
jgi:hypothetical protein